MGTQSTWARKHRSRKLQIYKYSSSTTITCHMSRVTCHLRQFSPLLLTQIWCFLWCLNAHMNRKHVNVGSRKEYARQRDLLLFLFLNSVTFKQQQQQQQQQLHTPYFASNLRC